MDCRGGGGDVGCNMELQSRPVKCSALQPESQKLLTPPDALSSKLLPDPCIPSPTKGDQHYGCGARNEPQS